MYTRDEILAYRAEIVKNRPGYRIAPAPLMLPILPDDPDATTDDWEGDWEAWFPAQTPGRDEVLLWIADTGEILENAPDDFIPFFFPGMAG